MPSAITLYLRGDKDKKHGSYIAALLHGFLMEHLDESYAARLHNSSMHPYSQSVREIDDKIIWTVNCLNDDAEKNIVGFLQNESLETIELKHRNEVLTVISRETKKISYQKLIEEYYLGDNNDNNRYISLRFLTPTSFKQNGEYCIFPSVRLIFQSLMKKFDISSEDNELYSDDVLEHYEKYAKIVRYSLRSTIFHVEGVKIPSFIGGITVKINGPLQMVNMARMLAEFGNYSGVGIKCGMGMGAMQFEKDKNDKDKRR